MEENFIKKLETKNYLIGSFDVYLDKAKTLIMENSNLTDGEADKILGGMPTAYRAAITDKNGQFIGYIGLFDVDIKNGISSLRFEVNNNLTQDDKNEIYEEFNNYLYEALNITDIDEFIYKAKDATEVTKREVTPKANIVLPSRFLVEGISEEVLEKFSHDYSIPKLQIPFTIKSGDRVLGIVGLSNLLWLNKRANLNIFLDKDLGSDITNELSGYIIDVYINHVHNSNVHSITLSVNGSNQEMLGILNKTNMNYYGQIPFGATDGKNIESNFLFQHTPNMKKEEGVIVPDNKSVLLTSIKQKKDQLAEKIELDNGFKLVSPKSFEKLSIDFNKVLAGHIKAMQNRNKFTIPLGEDKYFLQKGNEKYGLTKALMNYSYVVLDENDNYSGYINILRTNANEKNAEVEIGISPIMQNKGIGTMVINAFYEELFSLGYASVTSAVFEFNKPSLKLHDKVAELNGIRLEAYYINGKLWDMSFYSKINNELITEELKGKQR